MKFIYGELPSNKMYNFEGYQLLKEPRMVLFHAMAFIFSIMLCAVTFFIWLFFNEGFFDYFKGINPIEFLLVFILLIPLHELIHAIFYPLNNHKCIILGFWPKMGVFYATYIGRLSRNRWLTVYLAPFVIISLAPLAVMSFYTSS